MSVRSVLRSVKPLLAVNSVSQVISGSTVRRGASRLNPNIMASGGPVETNIKTKLEAALNPSHLQIINESYMHNVPPGSETHFKVVVVSEAFSDLPLIKRHRLVNTTLSGELSSGVHALSIVAKTPAQWSDGSKEVEKSPACRGGFGNARIIGKMSSNF